MRWWQSEPNSENINMDFQEFLRKQEAVYNGFRDISKVESEGTKPNIPVSQGGYLIVFRHALEISQKIGRFSKRIFEEVPAIVYDSATVHTTISELGIRELFIPEKNTLEKLCSLVREIVIADKPVVSYSEWLFNQNTVIVAGVPNQGFFDVAQKVYSLGERNNIKLRLPWGAQITANRFTETRTPEELKDFFKLMKESPVLGKSVLETIDVAYFYFNPNGFKITTYERFSLS